MYENFVLIEFVNSDGPETQGRSNLQIENTGV